jgi:F-type H+-transporting ATPase subunit a
MSQHFTYLNFIPNPDIQMFVCALVLGGALIGIAKKLGEQLDRMSPEEFAVPKEKASLLGVADLMVESFVKIYDSVLGSKNRKHISFVVTIFFFVLFSNLLGIIPGVPPITNCIWLNVGIALVVFIYFNACGIKENGLAGYLRHFAGPVSGALLFLVGPIIFCAEIFSTLLRPFTLNLRLYWNIKADHILMETIHNLLGPFSIGLASPLFVLALFVSLMQAFVFSMLTMIYVLLATAHEEDH